MTLVAYREAEHEKYVRAYASVSYGMGAGRMEDAVRTLSALPRGSYLDVGCGRGEMLAHAKRLGFTPVQGVEVVPSLIDGERVVLGEAHALPFSDNSFDVAAMFDVVEHLLRGDDGLACCELRRVARRHVLITANSHPSHLPDGTDLHINRRTEEEWDDFIRMWFMGAEVSRMQTPSYPRSPMWRIDL